MPHYDRNFGPARPNAAQNDSVFDDDDEEDAMDGAAAALREAEVEAVRPKPASPDKARLEDKSIDELRALAAKLDIPDRGTLTAKDQLIAAIRQRM